MIGRLMRGAVFALGLAGAGDFGLAGSVGSAVPGGVERLVWAYGSAIARIEGGDLVWHDATRMSVDDGRGVKSFEAWLATPDLKDMFRQAYPAGAPAVAPPRNFDPGRARNRALFDKLYGDCVTGGVVANLVNVVWLPKKYGKPLPFNGRHGAAERLAAVSRRLDDLPSRFDDFLLPPAGTYHCRPIAGTSRISAHGYGIAIDLAVKRSHYWRWAGGVEGAYRNDIPEEIVAAFEAEGFIWGGRWAHYDTMHFEYRPELIGPTVR